MPTALEIMRLVSPTRFNFPLSREMYKRILPQNGLHGTQTAFALEQVRKIVFYSGFVKQK